VLPAPGIAPAPGMAPVAVDRPFTPTMRFAISSTESNEWIVETGTDWPSSGSEPAGKVMLFAWRTPEICDVLIPASASFAGSSVIWIRGVVPPVASAALTPSSAWSSGTTSVCTISATLSSDAPSFPERDATMTGEALMFSEETCGETDCGSPTDVRFCSIVARTSFTFVPKENWATTRPRLFADVDWRRSSRGIPEIARSIGSVT